MKELPCPRCGKKTQRDFCVTCQRELYPLVEKIKDINITFCSESNAVKITHAWENIPQRIAIEKTVKRALVPHKEAKIKEIIVDHFTFDASKPGLEKKVSVPVVIRGERAGVMYEEEYDVPLIIKTTISPKYAKIGTDYFEATLQVRNETPEHVAAMQKLVNKHEGLAINKIKPHKNGNDYLMTKKHPMAIVGHELFRRFGGVMKENTRLITRDKQRSKDLHRLTIFIEYPSFSLGTVLTDDDGKKLFLVEKFGKKIRYRNLLTGKRVEEIYAPGKYSPVEIYETTITQTHPTVEILDPESYQQVPLLYVKKQDEPTFTIEQKVFVARNKDKLWFVKF